MKGLLGLVLREIVLPLAALVAARKVDQWTRPKPPAAPTTPEEPTDGPAHP